MEGCPVDSAVVINLTLCSFRCSIWHDKVLTGSGPSPSRKLPFWTCGDQFLILLRAGISELLLNGQNIKFYITHHFSKDGNGKTEF